MDSEFTQQHLQSVHQKTLMGEPGEDAGPHGSEDAASVSSSHDEGEEDNRRAELRARSPETEMASLVSRALVGDLQHLSTPVHITAEASQSKERTCCVCDAPSVYTCPGCGRRTCSMTCVRVHKADHNCTGQRDVTKKVPLSEFSDAQLQRDFRFLEDCRRVASNADRQLPRGRRFNFKALPLPLRALREAARRRGVVCQLMSDGMAKREANTSRYDRSTNTIIWRCDFVFHKESGDSFAVSTSWGSERHRLGDVVRFCWSTNPPLPCYHINQTYNHSQSYIGADPPPALPQPTAAGASGVASSEVGADGNEGHDEERDDEDDEEEGEAEDGLDPADDAPSRASGDGSEADENEEEGESDDEARASNRGTFPGDSVDGEAESQHGERDERTMDAASENADSATADVCLPAEADDTRDANGPGTSSAVAAPLVPPDIVPLTAAEVRNEALVREFLDSAGSDGWRIVAKAERLGAETRYFLLEPDKTLNENMRVLFFVNEYPVFGVVHASRLAQFPLVTDADKEAIRASFRPKERTPEELLRRQHPGIRLKADLDPEEAERLSKVPCRMNLQNRCVAGDSCPYWHCSVDEWPRCRSFEKHGRCAMGYRCSFRHGDRLPGERAAEEEAQGGGEGKRPRDWGRDRGRGRAGIGGRAGFRGRGGRGRGFRGGRGGRRL